MTNRQPFLSLSLAYFGLALAFLLLCGCGDGPPTATEEIAPTERETISVVARAHVGGNTLRIVVLPDGTKCVTMDYLEGVALDCDWRQPCAEKGAP